MGKGVVCTKVFQRVDLLCDYNGLLLEGDEASAYLKRSEMMQYCDTSYLFKFKCCEKL